MEDKRLLRVIWIILILLVIAYTVKILGTYMLSLQGALIFSLLLHPLYKKLHKKTGREGLSAFIIMISVLLLILIPLTWISFSLVNEASGLAEIDDEKIQNVENFLASIKVDVNIREEGARLIQNLKGAVFNNVVSLLQKATDFVINAFIFFFLMYYLLIHGPEVIKFICRYLPFDKKKNIDFLMDSKRIVKAVAYGSVLTALIQGLLGGLGFLIFGLNKALFWGFVMAVLSILPILGSWIVWIPGVIILIASGHIGAALGLTAWSLILVAQSDNILKPIITSKIGKVHPVVIILGVIAGIALFGMIGILSGPIILGLLVLVVEYFHNEKSAVVKKVKRIKRGLF